MQVYSSYLYPLLSKQQRMVEQLKRWANINSWSENPEGLEKMAAVLEEDFSILNGRVERLPLPPRKKIDSRGNRVEIPASPALSIKKREDAPIKILLAGHFDTVYSPESSFQSTERLSDEILRGPGVTDMKGGLVILLHALETFEKSPYAEKIGWEILLNPDEEIGSPSSQQLFIQKAPHFAAGLLFEPAFSDGLLVSERKGSINITLIAHGKAAHVGRDFDKGRNAISALAALLQKIETLNDQQRHITVNVGLFEGGGAPNIVPDLAISQINIRMQNPKDLTMVKKRIQQMIEGFDHLDGITFEWDVLSMKPPKPFNKTNRYLFNALKNCAHELGWELNWQPSGGVCDGNTLASAGLPTIDTLGAVGGHIHTHDEYILTQSLVDRARLSACFLMYMADKNKFLETSYD